MPLLMCPNDNAPMQTVQRGGVEFDMCPTCRGVWLDRGELEKLMALGRDDERPSAPPPQQYPPQAPPQYPPQGQPWGADRRPEPRYDDRRHDRDDRRYQQHGHYKKKKGFDLFDIFD